MLTVLEPCDSEYRVRALLLRPRQGVTSLLIGDIRVPAAASYPQFRSLLFFFFNLFTFPSPPFLFLLSFSLSLSLAPYRWDLLSLAVGYTPPPLVCISSGGTVQEQPHVTVRQREMGRGELEPEPSHAVDASSRRRISTSGAVFFPMSTSVSLTGLI